MHALCALRGEQHEDSRTGAVTLQRGTIAQVGGVVVNTEGGGGGRPTSIWSGSLRSAVLRALATWSGSYVGTTL